MGDKSKMETLLVLSLRTHSLIPAGGHVLVAVSGGIDSICLLHALIRLSRSFPQFRVSAAHLDHGLRPTSEQDAIFVRRVCEEWGVACCVERIELLEQCRRTGQGIEDAGRDARRLFLRRVAQAQGCDCVALAHHLDDQAETVLFRLTRGSAVSGLAAMAWQQGVFIRPLLNVKRAVIEAYRQQNCLTFVEDESNSQLEFSRNRIRHQVLPALREINPEVAIQLSRLASRVSCEESYWQQQVATFLKSFSRFKVDALRVEVAELFTLHPALRMRVIRESLQRVRGNLKNIEAVHIELVDSLLCSGKPQSQLDLPEAWVAKRYDSLVFCRQAPELSAPFSLSVPALGEYLLPTGQRLTVTISEVGVEQSCLCVAFDADMVEFPLRLRSVQQGDRMTCQGMAGHKKVKHLFAENRVEMEQRASAAVIEGNQGILWLIGIRRSDDFSVCEKTTRVLILSLSNDQPVKYN